MEQQSMPPLQQPPRPSIDDGTQTIDWDGQDGELSDREGETGREKLLAHEDKKKRYQSFKIRTISTFAILAAFFIFLYLGHVPCLFMLFFIQGAVINEFFAIARNSLMDKRLPGFRAQQWYFFLVSTFYLYGR
ncbi:hypothetical protein DUNSADRAFT_3902 [Dunaliella salina]|uniref:phosphatidate cytidylyltransferase n=1 Tax=Dunaliella salina TaxID=3046 RepID=A0ABQ7GT19_DUNSA|nr:hypothetical protein DUNSADRAFT_3902 [Dunaliella salina]|eukprot:KAF5837759.1 hypothetical protein DUNSADRAFT_3902 [Dunaliella salina]